MESKPTEPVTENKDVQQDKDKLMDFFLNLPDKAVDLAKIGQQIEVPKTEEKKDGEKQNE